MTSMEQPLKKRKLLPDPIPAASPPPPSPPQQQPHEELVTAPPPPSLQQLSQEEILRKRMNKEEVRSLYECYKRIRICLSKKDAGLVPDFEQAYLSFITASQGCTSVQRITAELIPRYASFCPSALEAAVKVAISMHNQSLSTIMKGEDFDCIAYQTAKACVFGLVDICLAASSEAPKSCVIRRICSGVYMHVMTFLTSTFEGRDVYQLSANEIMKLFGTAESFSQLKQERSETNEAVPYRLFKFHVHSLLRIFICCPRSSLTALFELLSGTNSGKQKNAEYFLCQVTSHLITDEFRHILSKDSNLGILFTNGIETAIEGRQHDKEKEMFPAGYDDQKQAHIPCKCLLKLLTVRDSSLSHWILSKYKRLSPTIHSEVVSKLSSSLACIFGSLSEITSTSDCYEDKDENNFDLLELINHPYMLHRPSIGLDKSGVLFGEDSLSKVPDAPATSTPHKNSGGNEIPDQMVKTCGLLLPCEINAQIRNSLSSKIEASRPKKTLGNVESENSCQEEPSVSKNIVESTSFKSKIHRTEAELESTSGIVTNSLSTSKHHMEINQSMWCYDSDATSMDVFSASNLLLLSSFGNDTPETAVRLQFEEFGPLEKFLFYPAKNFAVLEYRSIMDAVRARDYMHGSSPWGRSLSLKFLDIGFGSRGAVNGTVFSDSCFVYVGKVSSQQAKEEILYELSKWLSRPPLRIMDLGSGNTLLLEFVTSEEAAIATSYIRRKRCRSGCDISQGNNLTSSASRTDKSSGCRLLVRHIDMSVSDEELINVFSGFGELSGWKFMRQIGCCLMYFSSFQDALCAKTHLDGSRFGATPVRVEIMTDSSSSLLSPSSKTVENLSSDSSKISRQLSSRFASLHTKYNISQSSGNGETHKHKYSSSPMVDDHDHCVTNSLFVSFPDPSSQLITDHELLEICNIAAGNVGSVIRLTRTITNCSCYVEFSNKDAAVTAFGNMRNCQGMPFQIEFSSYSMENSEHDSNSPLWQHVSILDKRSEGGGNKRFKCNYCNCEFTGSYSRVKAHLLKIVGFGIKRCTKVSNDMHRELLAQMEEVDRRNRPIDVPLSHQSISSSGSTPNPMFSGTASGSTRTPTTYELMLKSMETKKRKSTGKGTLDAAFGNECRETLKGHIVRMFYAGGLPFHFARNPYYLKAFSYAANTNLGGFIPPGYNSLRTTLLKKERANIDRLLQPIKETWIEKGLSIVTDGWTDTQRRPLINFMTVTESGPIFLKAINCEGEYKDKFLIARLIKDTIAEVGAENVVQIITDNAPVCKAAGVLVEAQYPHIFWTPCVVHTLNLALKNICNPSPPWSSSAYDATYEQCKWIAEVYDDAMFVKNFIMNHAMRLAMFNEFVNLKLLSVAETRFASVIVMLKRFKLIKAGLQSMVISDRWTCYREDDTEKAQVIKDRLLNDLWWDKVTYILEVTGPIYDMLRFADTDKLALHLIYDTWDTMIEKVKEVIYRHERITPDQTSEFYQVIYDILVLRWNKSTSPLHCLAHSLNPRNHIDSSHHNEGYLSSGNRCASGHFLSHVEFHSISSDSKHGIHYGTEFQMKPDNISNLISPRMKVEAFGNEVQNANSCPPNWNRTDSTEASEPTGKGIDAHVTSHPTEQVWQCRNPDIDTQTLPPGNLSHIAPVRHGGAVILPPPPIQVSSFTPSYVTSSSSWNNMPSNSNVYSHQCAPVPFIPSSVTPLAQLQSNFIPHFEQTPPPPPPDVPPPPLPMCQPPPIPPPPSSPPLQPLPPQTHVKSSLQSKGSSENHKWLGTLCKSGVHYCTVYATRVNSDACNYSGTVFEPADWPAKLDITKRTDFRHVKATFISTPQHRREVCLLFPSSAADQKGFHDFISYLKQRECAGVIKIPSGTVRWARLLFILPCSTDICSLLSIPPQPSECLIALILPKETNPERVTS